MKLYVEGTHTEKSDMNTGIPRVVRNVLRNLLDLGREERIAVLPIIFRSGSFVVVSPEGVLEPKAPQHETGDNNGILGGWRRRLAWGLSARYRRLRRIFRSQIGRAHV